MRPALRVVLTKSSLWGYRYISQTRSLFILEKIVAPDCFLRWDIGNGSRRRSAAPDTDQENGIILRVSLFKMLWNSAVRMVYASLLEAEYKWLTSGAQPGP